ncbi:trap dicarboxylate transporter- dctm subunit [Roseibium sp. TrichSKD4]|uniref:TRAP transporter large permease subunit n=1 Tax=Roseibium sp. TrichSKD4 TaxID=744980 RepID=UPI0001E56BD1|nr:TRAP transporter large permease subunit [Roseibium sp. TrichSKD4]EFO31412.1 trap dicarboxylate transporter- dctm subunit [Roseibium sp. TrichSKD4]
MELFFLALLVLLMAFALGSGFPVAFALPGSAIITIVLAAGSGYLFSTGPDAFFDSGGAYQWLSAGVTNFRGIYWEAERDTLIAIPLFVFMGIMLQRSKIAEDLLVTMARLFGPVPGGLGISVVFVGALLAATTGIVGATVVAMGLISLPAMLRNNYSVPLATGTIAASGTLGQIIPPSIVLIILADQLASAVDQAGTIRQTLFKDSTGELSMPSDFAVVSTSAGEMFLGAFLPGLVLVGLYMLFILGFALINPKAAPAVHEEGSFNREFAGKVFMTLVPPLALIFLVLGSIIAGVATVNQAGAIGAVGAMVMAGYRLKEGEKGAYTPAILGIIALMGVAVVISFFGSVNIKRINSSQDILALVLALISVSLILIAIFWSGWRTMKFEDTLRGVMVETAKTTALVFIILLGAAMLTSAFRAFGGEHLVKEFLQGLPGGFWAQFLIVMLVIFILGFFLDFIEIAVVVVPIVAPILLADPSANVTAVWLGVMIGLNIQTSFLTPPFGFALFYLRGVAPAVVKTIDMYKGVIAFIALQLLALAIVGLFPQLVNYLPNRSSLLSETAPPPQNPRLQYCMENLIYEDFQNNGDSILSAISTAEGLDVSYLPKGLQKDLAKGYEKARDALPQMSAIREAENAVAAAAGDYRPLHVEVRALERDARRLDERIKNLSVIVQRAGPNGIYTEAQGAAAAKKIEVLTAEKEALLAQIPDEWEAVHKEFAAIQKAETNARRSYRRTVDDAYEPMLEVKAILRDAEKLAALESEIVALKAEIQTLEPAAAVEAIAAMRSKVGEVEGSRDIRKGLTDARKIMRSKTPDIVAASAEIDNSLAALAADLEWRQRGAKELLADLLTYDTAINRNIGLRQQDRLPDDMALDVAACLADHRDISLNF